MSPTCARTGTPYTVIDSEAAFAHLIDMPLLDLCPAERFCQLMATRNEWKLYHRTCDSTGEKILSAYPKDSPYIVYKNDVWWGDSWEALDYGRDFDFSRPFFEQFYELQLAVPREGTSVFQSENCEYNSHTRQSKNCYLNSLVVRAEDMHYSYWMVDVEDVVDSCFHISGISGKSVRCYECIDFSTCYQGIALQECYNCSDCLFSYQLRGCDHCLFCSNLSQKSYHIRNTPCTKEEFEQARAAAINGSYASWKKAYQQYLDLRAKAPFRATMTLNCENVIGDHLFDCRNCTYCFDGDHSEDCTTAISLNDSKDIHSCYSAGWTRCEQLWNCAVSRGCSDMAFCRYMWFCNDMRYSDSCQSCKHCFGCIGLRHKGYCILNKQYSKEEFSALRDRIIVHMKQTPLRSPSGSHQGQAEEWGAFWPYQYLPFAYNESAAQDYFPLTRAEAIKHGFRWRDTEPESLDVKKIIAADDLPDSIDDVPEDILQWAVRCERSGKPFRVIKQELDFYREMRLPLPRAHPTDRHARRMSMRNPYMLYDRTCTKCGTTIKSTHAPDRPETVYCEECYRKTVY
jgi:hypothetical protein